MPPKDLVGDEVVHKTLAVMVELLRMFGLIKGALLATDGQLEPTYARYKGCPDACEGCQQFPGDGRPTRAAATSCTAGPRGFSSSVRSPRSSTACAQRPPNKGTIETPRSS